MKQSICRTFELKLEYVSILLLPHHQHRVKHQRTPETIITARNGKTTASKLLNSSEEKHRLQRPTLISFYDVVFCEINFLLRILIELGLSTSNPTSIFNFEKFSVESIE